ncbi:hypothetical protein KAH55_02560 [bacterium]|nr:hypothetical protein [bacterium]
MVQQRWEASNLHTCILTGNPYDDRFDIRTDGVIVYGHMNFKRRADIWRQHNYVVHFMTGLTSGSYDEYLSGKFDNEKHYHERQQLADGTRLEKGPSLPLLSPTESFTKYLKQLIQQAIDADASRIYLTEPEYAIETGYSPVFKNAWRNLYGQAWQDQTTSTQNRYLSGLLKHNLFLNQINELTNFAKLYARSQGKTVECYIGIQSLISYVQWGLISPQSQLLDLPTVDGLLGMISMKTARTPNVYKGIRQQRTFETALLEYSYFANLTRGARQQLVLMHDPLDEHEENTWETYQRDYHATLAASLMQPDVSQFLTIPWPKRVLVSRFSREGSPVGVKTGIPDNFFTQILILSNAVKNINQAKFRRQFAGYGVGILVSDTALFQRTGSHTVDPNFPNFFGSAMPLIKQGIVPEIMPIEHLGYPGFLEQIQVLILSYSFMKPASEDYHKTLAEWVKAGHVLIFIDDLVDSFNNVPEWWNNAKPNYQSPAEHLFHALGISRKPIFNDVYFVGRGRVILRQIKPSSFTKDKKGAQEIIDLVKHGLQLAGQNRFRFRAQNYVKVRRGPYLVAAVLEESTSLKPIQIKGKLVKLFDHTLPFSRKFTLHPGDQGIYINLNWINRSKPRILASASSIQNIKRSHGKISFTSTGPANSNCITKIFFPKKPRKIEVTKNGEPFPHKSGFIRVRKILTLEHENCAAQITIRIEHPEKKFSNKLEVIKSWFPFLRKDDTEWH